MRRRRGTCGFSDGSDARPLVGSHAACGVQEGSARSGGGVRRRIALAAAGLAIGLISDPIVAAAWPFALAWWVWCETDESGDWLTGRADGGERK